MTDTLKGYRGAARSLLQSFGVRVWSDVVMDTSRGKFKGILLPRSETEDDKHVVLKLRTGYNVGLHVDSVEKVE